MITKEQLSLGDRLYHIKGKLECVVKDISYLGIYVLVSLPNNGDMSLYDMVESFSRVPCTTDNTKVGDKVFIYGRILEITGFEHNKAIFKSGFSRHDGNGIFQHLFIPLASDLPKPLASANQEGYLNGIEFGKAQAVRVVNNNLSSGIYFCEKCVAFCQDTDNYCHACGDKLGKK